MDIGPFVAHLRDDLLAAAESGGQELVQAAQRLGYALDPAARLALMEAVSQACAEITSAMPDGSVDVRLDGRDLAFVVDAGPVHPAVALPPAPPEAPAPPPPPAVDDDADDGIARVSLRLPESVKTRAEDAAAAAGQSLNTWLVAAVRAATTAPLVDAPGIRVDLDLGSLSFPFDQRRGPGPRRMTGWV